MKNVIKDRLLIEFLPHDIDEVAGFPVHAEGHVAAYDVERSALIVMGHVGLWELLIGTGQHLDGFLVLAFLNEVEGQQCLFRLGGDPG